MSPPPSFSSPARGCFITRADSSTAGYFDSAASFHFTHDLDLFVQGSVHPLKSPFSVHGATGPCVITHSGCLRDLPSRNGMNLGFYSAHISETLISLGYLQRCGAVYGCDPARPSTHLLIHESPGGRLLATAELSATNMLPVRFHGPPAVPSALSVSVVPAPSPSVSPPGTMDAQWHALLRAGRVTAEQIRRCDAVEQYHRSYYHPGDGALGKILDGGKLKDNIQGLTSVDVRLNRRLRGPCEHCAAAKYTEPPSPPSVSPPATGPGQVVSFDHHHLSTPAPGGITHEIMLVDEHTGFVTVAGAVSKKLPAVTAALQDVIARTYNAHGHRVGVLHGDAESINIALGVPLGSLGVRVCVNTPGRHAQRVERHTRTLYARSAAYQHSLQYYLPAQYEHYLHRAVAASMNAGINTQSAPLTAAEAFLGRSPVHQVPFGTVAMVSVPIAKRAQEAKLHGVDLHSLPKAEIGVVMGPSAGAADPLCLLANGQVVSRRVGILFPDRYVPFGWERKPVHRVDLAHLKGALLSDYPVLSDGDGDGVVPLESAGSLNTVCQVPAPAPSLNPPLESVHVVAIDALVVPPAPALAALEELPPAQPVGSPSSAMGESDLVPAVSPPSSPVPVLSSPFSETPHAGPLPAVPGAARTLRTSSRIAERAGSLPQVSPSVLTPTPASSRTVPVPALSSVAPPVVQRVSGRGVAHPPGFWSGAALAASVTCDCVPASDGFPVYQCAWCTSWDAANVAGILGGPPLVSAAPGIAETTAPVIQTRYGATRRKKHSPRHRRVDQPVIRPGAFSAADAAAVESALQCNSRRQALLAVSSIAASSSHLPAAGVVSAPMATSHVPRPPRQGEFVAARRMGPVRLTHIQPGSRSAPPERAAQQSKTHIKRQKRRKDQDTRAAVDAYDPSVPVVSCPVHLSALLAAQRPAVARKILNQQQATARDKAHRAAHFYPELSNRKTSLRPTPVPSTRSEMPLHRAMGTFTEKDIENSLSKELTKQFVTYGALRVIHPRDIENDAVFVRAQLLFKQKLSGVVAARMPMDGRAQTPDTFGATYAGTSDAVNRAFILSSVLAYAATSGKLDTFYTGKFDVPAAFLQELLPRSATGGKQFVTRMPANLPQVMLADGTLGPKGGDWAELLRTIYGLKQSNSMFDYGFCMLLLSGGFRPTASDPYTYVKWLGTDVMVVNMHVDDGSMVGTSAVLRKELQALLLGRYGSDMVFELGDAGICSVQTVTNPDRSVSLNMTEYTLSFLHAAGMDCIPGALTPAVKEHGGFFSPSTGSLLGEKAHKQFMRINGGMIHMLPVRYDIRMFVVHLCSKNQAPTQGDWDKQFHLLRYIKAFPSEGPTFSANPADYANGVTIQGASDSSHASHSEDGRSHTGYLLSVGTNNAPFLVYSRVETDAVPISPHDSEYMALSRMARSSVYFCQFSAELGFSQAAPTRLATDSQTAIDLTVAPAVSKHSRHVLQHIHFLRELFQRKQIIPCHQSTHDIVPNGLTKTLGPNAFLYFRHHLFHPFWA